LKKQNENITDHDHHFSDIFTEHLLLLSKDLRESSDPTTQGSGLGSRDLHDTPGSIYSQFGGDPILYRTGIRFNTALRAFRHPIEFCIHRACSQKNPLSLKKVDL
jgi:hypothetical protein